MSITAIHGDGKRRILYQYRPSTWVSHGIQTLCGIQYHKIRCDGSVRPGLFYRGWRYRVQQLCFAMQKAGRGVI